MLPPRKRNEKKKPSFTQTQVAFFISSYLTSPHTLFILSSCQDRHHPIPHLPSLPGPFDTSFPLPSFSEGPLSPTTSSFQLVQSSSPPFARLGNICLLFPTPFVKRYRQTPGFKLLSRCFKVLHVQSRIAIVEADNGLSTLNPLRLVTARLSLHFQAFC